jgi:hypothetical protein
LRTCGTIWGTHWEPRNPINPTTPSPSPKEKNWVGLPHWLPRIFMPTFLCFFFIIFGLGTQIVGYSQVTLLGYLTQINFGLL